MRQILCALLLVGLAACSDNASQQAQPTPPVATASASPDSVPATPTTTRYALQAVKLADIPAKLRLPGQLLEAWRWADANGENMLMAFLTVSTSTQQQANSSPDSSEVEDMNDFERTARLAIRQYVRQPIQAEYNELWRL